MAPAPIRYEVADRVATITLERPDALNGLTPEMVEGLHQAVKRAGSDAQARAVIVTGVGKAFCAGADVKQMRAAAEKGPEAAGELVLALTNGLHGAILEMKRSPKFFVTAVNGPAVGGGLGLALAGDVRIASDQAFFAAGYEKLSISPDGGSTILLPHLAGGGRAIDLLVTGKGFSADEAYWYGIVSEVTKTDILLERATETAHELASLGRGYVKNAKELLWPQGLEERLKEEQRRTVESVKTEDFAEGIRAFLEKRKAAFS